MVRRPEHEFPKNNSMLLKKKIVSSSIAEVVIALSIIAICFGITSLVFVRTMKVTTNFQDVKKQTEIQSIIWEALMSDDFNINKLDDFEYESFDGNDEQVNVYLFKGRHDKIIWQQEWLKNDEQ